MYDLENAVYVAGIAKTGKEDSISAMYQNLSLGLVVDRTTGQTLDLGCSMVMEETVYFVRQLLVGKRLVEDTKEMVELLCTRFFALSQKALIAALYDAQNHYLMAMAQLKESEKKQERP